MRVCGLLQIWRVDVFRRGDVIYDVKDASADGELLRIDLRLPGNGSAELLEIETPAQASLSDGSLRIEAAQRIRGFGREWRPGRRGPAVVMQ